MLLSRLASGLKRASLSTTSLVSCKIHTLPDLPYDYTALEPVVSSRIMEIHHKKHHQAYVTNLNIALEKVEAASAKGDIVTVDSLKGALRFNGGGHANHSLFWKVLAPSNGKGGVLPDSNSKLAKEVVATFGSFEQFIEKFNAQATAVQGSGWGWLVYDPVRQKLSISTTPNQDRPQDHAPVIPIFGIDVWEHAYYLDYENRRPDYLKNIWKVVNWSQVEQNFANVA